MENKTGLRKTVRSREVSGLGRVSGPEVSVYMTKALEAGFPSDNYIFLKTRSRPTVDLRTPLDLGASLDRRTVVTINRNITTSVKLKLQIYTYFQSTVLLFCYTIVYCVYQLVN